MTHVPSSSSQFIVSDFLTVFGLKSVYFTILLFALKRGYFTALQKKKGNENCK
jgi:hypothetical protein